MEPTSHGQAADPRPGFLLLLLLAAAACAPPHYWPYDERARRAGPGFGAANEFQLRRHVGGMNPVPRFLHLPAMIPWSIASLVRERSVMTGYGRLVIGLLGLMGLAGCNEHYRGYGSGYRPTYGGSYNRGYDNRYRDGRDRDARGYQDNRGASGNRGGWGGTGSGGGSGRGSGGPGPNLGDPPANHQGN